MVMESMYEYGRSVLFMSFLVGLLRAGLCCEFLPEKQGIFPAGTDLLTRSPKCLQYSEQHQPVAYYSSSPTDATRSLIT